MVGTSLFLSKVGDSPVFRILEFFLEARTLDHAIADVLADVAISRNTFYKYWSLLLTNEFIVCTRKVGKTKLYALHTRNPYVKHFIRIFDQALREDMSVRRQTITRRI